MRNSTLFGISACFLRVVFVAILLRVCVAAQAAPEISGNARSESPSSEVLVPAKSSNGKWGYQDKYGAYVIPPQFVHAEPFHNDLALVCTTWGFNLFGKTEGVYLFARVGYIDRIGKFAIGPLFAEGASDFSEGLAAFQPGISSWGTAKWGYLDKTGKWAIKPRFVRASDFSEGIAAVQVLNGKEITGKEPEFKWGYIDHTGSFVIPPQFDGAMPFKSGVAIVRTQVPPGLHIHPTRCIDRKGNFVTACPPARKPEIPDLGK